MITAKVTGLDELRTIFKTIDLKKQRQKMRALLEAAGAPIRDRAEQLVAVGEAAPHIHDHIVIKHLTSVDDEVFTGRRRLEPGEYAIAIGPTKDFFYGKFLERGTVKMQARPFMRPAWDETGAEVMHVLTHGIPAVVVAAFRAAGSRTL